MKRALAGMVAVGVSLSLISLAYGQASEAEMRTFRIPPPADMPKLKILAMLATTDTICCLLPLLLALESKQKTIRMFATQEFLARRSGSTEPGVILLSPILSMSTER